MLSALQTDAKPLDPTVIFISGATGEYSGRLFGFYEPTGKKNSDGHIMYKNRFHPNTVVEHFGGKWQLKDVSNIRKNIRFAEVAGFCPFEACKSKEWEVANGVALEHQPSVKMVTGADAEAQASGCFIVAVVSIPLSATSHSPKASLQHMPPFSPSIFFTRVLCLTLIALVFFVCRPLSLLLLLLPTIPEPRPSASAEQPAKHHGLSTESSTQLGRRVWMAVFFTRSVLTPRHGLSTLEDGGRSNMHLL
jgi:hypothetical protein